MLSHQEEEHLTEIQLQVKQMATMLQENTDSG
jgi:hypothetical protein